MDVSSTVPSLSLWIPLQAATTFSDAILTLLISFYSFFAFYRGMSVFLKLFCSEQKRCLTLLLKTLSDVCSPHANFLRY